MEHRLGHALLDAAKAAKIAVADAGSTGQVDIPLDAVENGLAGHLNQPGALAALEADMARIAAAGVETARRAGVAPEQVDGPPNRPLHRPGVPGHLHRHPLRPSRTVPGDYLASVAGGLGRQARSVFG